jgi:hypothetical protein
MAYTTRADVEAYLRTTFNDTDAPTASYVDDLVDEIDSEVDRLTGTTFTVQDFDEILSCYMPCDRFLIAKYPVLSIDHVYKNTGTEWVPVWTELAEKRVLKDIVYLPATYSGGSCLRVTGTYGFEEVPSEVRHLATLLVVKKLVSGESASSAGTSAVSIGPLSITKNVGVARLVNINQDITEAKRRVGTFKTVFGNVRG